MCGGLTSESMKRPALTSRIAGSPVLPDHLCAPEPARAIECGNRGANSARIKYAGLLAGAQAVEHYEISRYGTLKTWANELGLGDAVGLLDATLEEEKKTDATLTKIAESVVNQEAQ